MSGPRLAAQPGTVKDGLQKLMELVLNQDAIVGKVTARQFLTPTGWALPDREPYGFWCDVQPEKEGEELLQYVPMSFRVMNYADDLGFILVPKMNTEVLVSQVDGRPTIEACQEWDYFILKKGEDFYLTVDDQNNVELQTTGAVDVKVAKTSKEQAGISKQIVAPQIVLGSLGSNQAVLGNMLQLWLSSHTHGTLKPGDPTTPPLQTSTLPGILSLINKLD